MPISSWFSRKQAPEVEVEVEPVPQPAPVPEPAPFYPQEFSMPSPSWLSRNEAGSFIVNQDIAYPVALDAMGVSLADANASDLEMAFQCIKMKVQDIVADMPNQSGPTKIFFEGQPDQKELYRQSSRAAGKPLTPGALRETYQKIRARLSA
jgi:hypothetical protein